jgi:hypothetical protein
MAITKVERSSVIDFHFFGMRVTAARSALYGSIALSIIGAICAAYFAKLTILDSIIAGILAMLLHWLGEIVHQYGHFLAAKAVGHPMIGTRLWMVLGMSLYPKDEAALPPDTHIRRALGGPAISFVVLSISIVLWLLLNGFSPMLNFLLAWVVWEHILIYAGGALLPINFPFFTVDGGTILYWLRKKQANLN